MTGKGLCAICICLVMLPACASLREVGTITYVKSHQAPVGAASDIVSYDVSKVKDTIYVLLYIPPLGETSVRYASARDILVLVGKKTITYNALLGSLLGGSHPDPKTGGRVNI